MNLLAATLGLLPDPVAHFFDSGKRPARVGNRNPTLTPAEAFRTQDGWLNVVLMNPEQWDRFCRVLGDEVLRTEPRFATNLGRLENHDEMKARVETALAAGTTAEWVTRFEAASIAGGPIYELDEVFGDPQVRHLGLLAEVAQPTYEAHGGRARMLGFPFRASATPADDPAARAAARRAHRRGADRGPRALPRGGLAPGGGRRDRRTPRAPEPSGQPAGRVATKR